MINAYGRHFQRTFRAKKIAYLVVLFISIFVYAVYINGNQQEIDGFSEYNKEYYFDRREDETQPSYQEVSKRSNNWLQMLRHGYESNEQKCPDYLTYASSAHPPYSKGSLRLPYMRPTEDCRTFNSHIIEKIIEEMTKRIEDPDIARLFENCFPNTLDTTILWHNLDIERDNEDQYKTFVVTGDIHAEWLRDSARQLSVYQPFAKHDENLKKLILGAINLQASYISKAPYCNAFQPPLGSNIGRRPSAIDEVFPSPPWDDVFECKYELDSLASFLTLSNEYFENTQDDTFVSTRWIDSLEYILTVLKRESSPTFDKKGAVLPFYYTFQRHTKIGSETLPNSGNGNPVNFGTRLIRSAFRPSDDACIYQFFIPANIHMLVELKKVKTLLRKKGLTELTSIIDHFTGSIETGIKEFGIVNHPIHGKVYAYEIDGYGGQNIMDDANIPSLLSIPDLGYLNISDPIYQNTRRMVLDKRSNPYYFKGKHFEGIGGPHIGLNQVWPMSKLMEIRTTDDDDEIYENLKFLRYSTNSLGLMHESIDGDVYGGRKFTRPWFAWCNSEFGKTILDLAKRKPHIIFKEKYMNKPFIIDDFLMNLDKEDDFEESDVVEEPEFKETDKSTEPSSYDKILNQREADASYERDSETGDFKFPQINIQDETPDDQFKDDNAPELKPFARFEIKENSEDSMNFIHEHNYQNARKDDNDEVLGKDENSDEFINKELEDVIKESDNVGKEMDSENDNNEDFNENNENFNENNEEQSDLQKQLNEIDENEWEKEGEESNKELQNDQGDENLS